MTQLTGPGLPTTGVNYTYQTQRDQLDRLDFGPVATPYAWANPSYEFETATPPDVLQHRGLIRSVENGYRDSGGLPVTLSKYAYRNDVLGRRMSVAQTGEAFNAQPWHYRFGYNNRSELTGADRFQGTNPDQVNPLPSRQTPSSDFDFAYDHIGNRLTAVLDASATGYTITNKLNQYDSTANPATGFGYDDDGNLTDDGRYAYVWDGENRLVCIEKKAPNFNGDKRLTFQYDYLGRRIAKMVETYSGGAWQQTESVYFLYDGWEVLEVVDAVTGQLKTQYAWGMDLSGSLQGAGGIGGLLAAKETQGTTAGEDDRSYWFFYDANGNVGQVLDATNTAAISLAARYEYDPYGNTLTEAGPYAAANPFRFSTKWLDHEAKTTNPAGAVGTTGLYYYGYRYYSPNLGRWISRDPMQEKGGDNLLTFVNNGPAIASDLLGLKILAQCSVAGLLEAHSISFEMAGTEGRYYRFWKGTGGDGSFESEVLLGMLNTFHVFKPIDGEVESLRRHVEARKAVVEATNVTFGYGPGAETVNETFWLPIVSADPNAQLRTRAGHTLYEALGNMWATESASSYSFGCFNGALAVMARGVGSVVQESDGSLYGFFHTQTNGVSLTASDVALVRVFGGSRDIWVPGDWGGIINKGQPDAAGHEGVNMIYIGGDRFWVHGGGVDTLPNWFDLVASWSHGAGATVSPVVHFPRIGMEQ